MKTIQEKITLAVAALLYLLFHLRGGADAEQMLTGTLVQLLTTLPYCIGFTFILVRIIQYLHSGQRLPWDRIIRIFFTIGILFGFFFALYEYAEQAQLQDQPTSSFYRPDQQPFFRIRAMPHHAVLAEAGRNLPNQV
jgi:hypothetical protein